MFSPNSIHDGEPEEPTTPPPEPSEPPTDAETVRELFDAIGVLTSHVDAQSKAIRELKDEVRAMNELSELEPTSTVIEDSGTATASSRATRIVAAAFIIALAIVVAVSAFILVSVRQTGDRERLQEWNSYIYMQDIPADQKARQIISPYDEEAQDKLSKAISNQKAYQAKFKADAEKAEKQKEQGK